MNKKILITFISVIFFSIGIFAQNIKPEEVVDISYVANLTKSKVKTAIDINFNLKIENTWHINANKPIDNSLTPTVLKIDPSSNYEIRKIEYPPAEMMKLQFSENELALYETEATIKAKLIVREDYKEKNLIINGELQYQPCNNQTCLFPVSKPFSIKIKLEK